MDVKFDSILGNLREQDAGGASYEIAPAYAGTDAPGTGSNALSNGQSRIWRNTATGATYYIVRMGSQYFGVELCEM